MQKRNLKRLLILSIKQWAKHNPLLIGAAISFYIILSCGPILAVTIFFLGEIFGKQAAEGNIAREINRIVGEKPAEIFSSIVQQASTASGKTMAFLSSIPLLFFGTTMVFFQVRNALNIIWEVEEESNGIKSQIRNYSFSFIMLLVVGFIFFLVIIKSYIISSAKSYIDEIIKVPAPVFYILNILITYLIITILFAAVYKFLIKAELKPRAIWVGAAVTAFFFSLVQLLIGINTENSSIDSAFGAIGSLTILVLWIFYSSLIFLLGASFTKVYSEGI